MQRRKYTQEFKREAVALNDQISSSISFSTFRYLDYIGRGDRIWTYDLCLPKAALYQAELHPDSFKINNLLLYLFRYTEKYTE